jgi:hypothetical protein
MCHAIPRDLPMLTCHPAAFSFTQTGMYYMTTLYPKYVVGFRVALFVSLGVLLTAYALPTHANLPCR